MYAGTTLRDKSGHAIGVHQRIDRLARLSVRAYYLDNAVFPGIREILHFEGDNGPDGIKRKSPGHDEPWHEIDPLDPNDHALIDIVRDHRLNLVEALRLGNRERAAFEAAWLAHAITDGLTPAHQHQLSARIEELWGKPSSQRIGIRDKILIKGTTKRQTIVRNWKYWGSRGVFTTHYMYELGVATSIATHKFPLVTIDQSRLETMRNDNYEKALSEAVQEVYAMNIYRDFWQHGWTTKTGRITRTTLIPLISEMVALAWLSAYEEAFR